MRHYSIAQPYACNTSSKSREGRLGQVIYLSRSIFPPRPGDLQEPSHQELGTFTECPQLQLKRFTRPTANPELVPPDAVSSTDLYLLISDLYLLDLATEDLIETSIDAIYRLLTDGR